MSYQLKLFKQVKIGERFTFESPNNPDVRIKSGENIAHINPGVLVFTLDKQTDEVFAVGDAQELL